MNQKASQKEMDLKDEVEIEDGDQLITFADQKTPDSVGQKLKSDESKDIIGDDAVPDESRNITTEDAVLLPSNEVATTLIATPIEQTTRQQSLIEIIECKELISGANPS